MSLCLLPLYVKKISWSKQYAMVLSNDLTLTERKLFFFIVQHS